MNIMIKNSKGSIFFSLHWSVVLPATLVICKTASAMLV